MPEPGSADWSESKVTAFDTIDLAAGRAMPRSSVDTPLHISVVRPRLWHVDDVLRDR
jgi:hypothetical protein